MESLTPREQLIRAWNRHHPDPTEQRTIQFNEYTILPPMRAELLHISGLICPSYHIYLPFQERLESLMWFSERGFTHWAENIQRVNWDHVLAGPVGNNVRFENLYAAFKHDCAHHLSLQMLAMGPLSPISAKRYGYFFNKFKDL